MRPAVFHPKALEVIRSFPKDARLAIGKAVLELQRGVELGMPVSRRMPGVAPGASELRVKDAAGSYRAFYFLKSSKGVLVFHAFEKRTRKTPPHEIALGRRRLNEVLR